MSRLSRGVKIGITLFVIVVGGYSLGRLGFSFGMPSKEFTDARLQGALIAQDIVNLSNQVGVDLETVHKLEEQKSFADALILTADLVKKSREVRQRAIELSMELEKMTRALTDITSTDARQAALESIASRMTLINRLINYSDYLSQLLTALQARFEGAKNAEEIATLINQINGEVTAINSFNQQAGQAMDRFDAIINK